MWLMVGANHQESWLANLRPAYKRYTELGGGWGKRLTMDPVPISDALLAFPADLKDLLPPWDQIPDEFKEWNCRWARFADYWFRQGLAGTTEFYCKDGIDGATAVRHLQAILGSYQPKHEHKLAGVAYLCSQWFESVENYEVSERTP